MAEELVRLGEALVERYRIERELGAGGMATVYLAEDLRHQRKVAVKVLHPEIAAALGRERFLREITTTANLRHPHILPLYDSGEAGGFLFYVMPFVEGETLRERLERERQLPLDDALRIAQEVGDALSYAHARGVIHRDIKPENILLESGHAVVADFGIARAVSAAGGEKLTRTGVAIGTPSYMSPEQAVGDEELDGRSDLYALGCVLYEMLAGEPPFTGPTAQAIIARQLSGEIPSLQRLRDVVTPALERSVRKTLAKVPADRFATADQFVAALREAAAATVSHPAASKPRGRFLRIAAFLGVGLAATAAIVTWSMVGARRSEPGSNRPSIAVLPFENLGPPADEYFADGITEEMTSRLAQISGLKVTSRTSTLRYKGTTKPLPDLATELGVEYVLEGSVRTDQGPDGTGNVRVTPQLIRAVDDSHIWSQRYDASLQPGEIFAVQADIAERVAQALDVALLGGEREAVRQVPTDDAAALDAYRLGRFHWNKRTPDDLLRAERYFRDAVGRDPGFAQAYAGLADAYSVFQYYSVPGYTREEVYDLAETAARRAIELDESLAEAHASLANILNYGRWDWAEADLEFRKAIALDPEYAVARYWYAEYLLIVGRLDEALGQVQAAVELDPASAVAHHNLASVLYVMDRPDEAIAQFRVALAFEPDYSFSQSSLGLILARRGELDAARGHLVSSGVVPREVTEIILDAYGDAGARARALVTLRNLPPASVPAWMLGFLYAMLGDADGAFAAFERSFERREESLVYNMRFPELVPLRQDRRYGELMRRIGVPP